MAESTEETASGGSRLLGVLGKPDLESAEHGTLAPPGSRVLIRPQRRRALLAAAWLYAGVVLLVLVLLRWVGGGWWGVTLLLLMPRWVFLIPVGALAVASGIRRCPWDWLVHAVIGLAVAGPLMGFSAPVRRLIEGSSAVGEPIRIVTFNQGETPIRAGAFRDWLAREKVDVVCLQEVHDDPEKTREWLGEGWQVSREGSVASRWPIVSEMPRYERLTASDGRWTGLLERIRLRTRGGAEILVASAHLPTLRPGLETFLKGGGVAGLERHDTWWRSELERMLSALAEVHDVPMIVAGDFNKPSDDSTMATLRSHFRFAFEEAGWGYGYTRPARIPWIRIDHILTGPEWCISACRVGPDFGSDHLPLLADLVLKPARARQAP
jgi:endonuclease/exonuclease/phosphatase family metal-dependent hydrolase